MLSRYGLVVLLGVLGAVSMARAEDQVTRERRVMMGEVEALFERLKAELGARGLSMRVREAMLRVPRHELVPEAERDAAYRNRPLSIGHGQTISQPFIVALMTELADIKSGDRVLEVGTGSGYQAAILAELAREVYSIEIVEELAQEAKASLDRLGYTNVTVRAGDGYAGWPDKAPFDAVVVTAAPDHIPAQLVEQLRPGGRLVIPVGGLSQDLLVIEKKQDGSTTSTEVIPVRFVPLTRGEGAHQDE